MKPGRIVLSFAGTLLLVISCNKSKLNQPALEKLDESKLANRKGVERLLIGAYSLLDGITASGQPGDIYGHSTGPSNWVYGSICGSEAYKGSDPGDQNEINEIETFKPLSTNSYLKIKWIAIYAGVARSNTVLRVMKKATDIDSLLANRIEGEARFLRAFYHFEATKIWGKVPFVDETVTYEVGNYHLSNDTFIWGAIENDLKFAVSNLPAVPVAVGRVNQYAAEAFLAKAYLFQHKFIEAQPLLEDLINNGVNSSGDRYDLILYPDNFNAEKEQNVENVFSVQMSVNDGAEFTYPDGFVDGGYNGNLSDELNFPEGPNSLTPCCSFFRPSLWLVNHFKTDPGSGLPDLDHFNEVDIPNDQGITATDPFTPYAGALDPRLDWTVGRRGIPYLDWDHSPDITWSRDQINGGPYFPKKNVFLKSQAGTLSYVGWVPMASAKNVNVLRFSDILLWAAEVEAETGNYNKARDLVNRVRRRAADQTAWIRRADGSLAANYVIGEYTETWPNRETALKAIRFERVLELGMEGHRFFDLVRWGIAATEIKAYLDKEKSYRNYLTNANFRSNCNEYFPIPQREIELSAGADGVRQLKQNFSCY